MTAARPSRLLSFGFLFASALLVAAATPILNVAARIIV